MQMQKRKEGAIPVEKRGEAFEEKGAFRQKVIDLKNQDSLPSGTYS